jgi:hypothetical protein
MKLELSYVLRGQGLTQMVWKPCIMVPSHRIMAKAILQAGREEPRHPVATLPGEDAVGSRTILLFHIATGGLRLSDEAAADLYQTVSHVMREEGVMP